MNTFNITPTTTPPIGQSMPWRSARSLLRGRSLLIITLILAAVGAVAGWAWFGTAMLPLLYVLPCAAMMAMCMKEQGSSNSSAAKPDNVAGTSDTGLPQ